MNVTTSFDTPLSSNSFSSNNEENSLPAELFFNASSIPCFLFLILAIISFQTSFLASPIFSPTSSIRSAIGAGLFFSASCFSPPTSLPLSVGKPDVGVGRLSTLSFGDNTRSSPPSRSACLFILSRLRASNVYQPTTSTLSFPSFTSNIVIGLFSSTFIATQCVFFVEGCD